MLDGEGGLLTGVGMGGWRGEEGCGDGDVSGLGVRLGGVDGVVEVMVAGGLEDGERGLGGGGEGGWGVGVVKVGMREGVGYGGL